MFLKSQSKNDIVKLLVVVHEVFEGHLSVSEEVVEGGDERVFDIGNMEMGGRRRRRDAKRRKREKRNKRREKVRRGRVIHELDRWLFFPMCNPT